MISANRRDDESLVDDVADTEGRSEVLARDGMVDGAVGAEAVGVQAAADRPRASLTQFGPLPGMPIIDRIVFKAANDAEVVGSTRRPGVGPSSGGAGNVGGDDDDGEAASNDNEPRGPIPLPPSGGAALSPPVEGDAEDTSLPGSDTIPAVWTIDHPHVARLLAAIRVDEAEATSVAVRQTATHLRAVIERDGVMPSAMGRLALRVFAMEAGVGRGAFNIGRPARALVDRYAPALRLSLIETRTVSRAGVRPSRSSEAVVREMMRRWEVEGLALPTRPDGGIYWTGVAEAAGVIPGYLGKPSELRRWIEGLVEQGRLSLGAVRPPKKPMRREEIEARADEIVAALDTYDVDGGSVPESAERRGLIDWRLISLATGRPGPTMQLHPRVKARAAGIVVRRGMMLPGLASHHDTLVALREAGLDRIREDLLVKGRGSVEANVSNYRSTFDRMVSQAAVGSDEGTAAVFGDRFDAILDEILLTFGNPRSASNFRRMARWWRDMRVARLGAAALPDKFHLALDVLLRRRGIVPSALAHAIGLRTDTVCSWLTKAGVTAPRVDAISRAERVLGVPAGTLLLKLRFTQRGLMGKASEHYLALPRRVRPLLPSEAVHWPEDRLKAAVAQVAHLVSGGTAYGRMQKVALTERYRLPPFDVPPMLAEHTAAYKAYKMAPVPYPYERPASSRWKSEGSANLRLGSLMRTYRLICQPVAEGPKGGLGAEGRSATLAWVAHAPLMLSAISLAVGRVADLPFGDGVRGIRFGSYQREVVRHLVSLTNPVTGWLVQNPKLAEALVPLPTTVRFGVNDHLLGLFGVRAGDLLLDEAAVRSARSDWKGFVAKAHVAYVQALAYVDDVVEVSRDPIEAIAGLVEADEPQAELLYLIIEAEKRWSEERSHPLNWRCDVRDSVMQRIAATTALRPANLAGMVYTGDADGEIRKVDGRWEIEIGYRKFKNYQSTRLFGTSTARRNYHLQLRDEAGLYDLLDGYFGDVLPAMRPAAPTTSAFLTRTGRPMTAERWGETCRQFGMMNIAWNPLLRTGMPGVLSMYCYAFRHIRASDILKHGTSANRVEEAAFALQTGEDMVRRHYGFMMPKEAIRESQDTFGRATRIAAKRLGR